MLYVDVCNQYTLWTLVFYVSSDLSCSKGVPISETDDLISKRMKCLHRQP